MLDGLVGSKRLISKLLFRGRIASLVPLFAAPIAFTSRVLARIGPGFVIFRSTGQVLPGLCFAAEEADDDALVRNSKS